VEPRRLPRGAACPCGSGNVYQDCCWNKDFEWLQDEEGTIIRSVPIGEELREALKELEHGREPSPGELFEGLPHPEHLELLTSQAMKEANIDPALIYAYERTGLIVAEHNQNLIPEADLARWHAAVREYRAKHHR
jgi:hypothetical protein